MVVRVVKSINDRVADKLLKMSFNLARPGAQR